MRVKLVTSLNKQLYEKYAKDNFKSWVNYLYLPEGSEIEVWFNGEMPQGLPQRTNNGTPFKYKILDVQSEGWKYFISSYKNHPRPKAQPGQEYMFNFVPFSCKVYALAEASWDIKSQYTENTGPANPFTHVIWVDADIELLQTVDETFLQKVAENSNYAWLDRSAPWTHGETGFMMATADPDTLDLFLQVANCYGSGQLFHFAQWHDAFIYTAYLKLKAFTEPNFIVKNLNGDVNNESEQGLHPFKTSILSKVMRHDKGQLKFNKEAQQGKTFSEVVFN